MKLRDLLHNWITRHAQVALHALGRLYRAPAATAMTAAVVAIALALPSSLYLITANLQRLGTLWDNQATISLFLQRSVTVEQAQALRDELAEWPETDQVNLITPAQALEEFREMSGFGATLDVLPENPLPPLIAVKPRTEYADADTAGVLFARLDALPETDFAQLDLQWVKRFEAMLTIVHRSITVMALLLSLAVLLIIGNTIRLEIQNRREEIEITKLIGATNAFIRRPFLYSGLWYGAIGAVFAALTVELAFLGLRGPVRQLAGLYSSGFSLQTFSVAELAILLGSGLALGLLGAWLAVARHLAAIEPGY